MALWHDGLFRQLAEESPDLFLELDATGRVRNASCGARLLLGREPEELLGAALPDFVAEGELADLESQLDSGTEGGTGSATGVLRVRDANGEWLDCRATAVSAGAEADRRTLLRLELTRPAGAPADAREKERRLDSLGSLAGGFAHDFSNLLQVIQGFSYVALEGADDAERVRDAMRRVIQAGERSRELLQQILTFSRTAEGESERRPVRLQQLLRDAARLIRSAAAESVELREEVDPECPAVMADPTQVSQVLNNLCANALDAMSGGGGVLELRLERCTIAAEAVRPGQPAAGEYALLRVADTGVGMSAEVQERIFEPFFSTKDAGSGAGLGLSAVHGIVRDHRGVVRVTSAPGEGTEIWVYFPVSDLEQTDGAETLRSAAGAGERILFVEDDAEIALLGLHLLKRLGFRAEVKIGGAAALEEFRAAPGEWDALVCDYDMPGMDGAEFARRAAQLRAGVPVLLVTGRPELLPADVMARPEIGGIVTKPYTGTDLGIALRHILDSPASTQAQVSD